MMNSFVSEGGIDRRMYTADQAINYSNGFTPVRLLHNVESRRRQPNCRYGGHGSAAPNNGIFAYPFFGSLI
jgi:hypothetical protein